MPALEKDDPALFHEEARRMEHEDSGWKGMFLCSVFLIHARVPDEDLSARGGEARHALSPAVLPPSTRVPDTPGGM